MEPAPTFAACSACGTSVVNHRLLYVHGLVEEVVWKMAGAFSWLPTFAETSFTHRLYHAIFSTFRLLGIARFNTDPEKALSDRSRLIWDEAAARGIPMEQIVFFGKHLEEYRARINGQWIYFQSLPIPYWLPQEGYDWADDKLLLSKKLAAAGVPAPKARCVTSWKDAEKAFAELTKPVILKPRHGSRGRHTTTHLTTLPELKKAFELGKVIARELLIQEHLFGSVCRATVINGALVGFFKADPPHVVGDGVHTVRELIEMKNKTRDHRVGEVRVTDDVLAFLARKGYSLESIVPKNEVLDLTAKTGRFFGGQTKEMLSEVHPKIHEIFKKAAEVVKAPVIGFDFIIEDPTKDPTSERCGIIECNTLPFIDLHYFALEGPRNNLASNVWDLWLK